MDEYRTRIDGDATNKAELAESVAGPRPGAARLVGVVARVRADAARERALRHHELLILARALAILGPVDAIGSLVVAEARVRERRAKAEQRDRCLHASAGLLLVFVG